MTTVAVPQQAPDLREPKGWRSTKNRIMTVLMVTSFVLVIIPLGFVLFTVIAKGASIISWQFLTGSPIPPNVLPAGIGGMWPAILGTLEITVGDCLVNVPEAPPESVAYLTIVDHKPGQADEKLFAGWMFASTPSLSALDHGVYDVRVLSCTMAQGSAPPSSR